MPIWRRPSADQTASVANIVAPWRPERASTPSSPFHSRARCLSTLLVDTVVRTRRDSTHPNWAVMAPSAPTAEGAIRYGYQWWIAADAPPGEFFARGIYGQYVYINKPAGVVIAVNSADRKFREPGVFEQNLATFRRIAAALQ